MRRRRRRRRGNTCLIVLVSFDPLALSLRSLLPVLLVVFARAALGLFTYVNLLW